ncbi:MAG: hypothetical protein AB7X20_05985 [Alphaproteobacteria bacterium]
MAYEVLFAFGFGRFGGTILVTARSKRSHASGSTSIVCASLSFRRFALGAAMPDFDNVTYPDNLKINLPEAYLTAIGKVCVQWAQLEVAVDFSIRKFAGFDIFDSRSAVVTAHMPWPLRMDVLKALVSELTPSYPRLERFRKVEPLLTKAQNGRNRIVHGFWAYTDGRASVLRATARGKLRTSNHPISVSDIEVVVDDIGRAAAALYKLVLDK